MDVLDPGAQDRLDSWLRAVYQPEPTPGQAAARRLAAALRLVIDRLIATGAPAADLAAAAEYVEGLAERLASFPHGGIYRDLTDGTAEGHPSEFFDFAPFLGRANALAPPLTLSVAGDRVLGTARFGHAYEGPPGCVHGGVIAACFDDVLGVVQTLSGQIAMTGRLAIRYTAPTPLGVDVRFVGTLVGIEGRKVSTHASLYAGDQRTAEADGLFIVVGTGRFESMRADAAPEVNPPAT